MLKVPLVHITLISLVIVITINYIKLNSSEPKKIAIGELFTFISAFFVTLFVIGLISYPEECYQAAVDGVDTWINIVLPALLPFFIGAELLIDLGVINLIGIMLEPVIRPLFKTPGASAFVFIMSMASGYPVGVKLVCNLRENRMCTRAEGQRMLAFCSTSGPLFIIGAVAIGMLGNPPAGVIMAASHYLSAIMLGTLIGFLSKDKECKKQSPPRDKGIKRAIGAMLDKRKLGSRPFGVLWGDAVKNSVNTLLVVGGFIIMFSVIIKLFYITGALRFFAIPIEIFFSKQALPRELIQPTLSGMLEITIGSRQISRLEALPLIYAVCSLSLIIGWSGFSIHAQALSFISRTDLNPLLYMASKLFHGILSCIVSYMLCLIFLPGREQHVFFTGSGILKTYTSSQTFFQRFILSATTFFIALFLVAALPIFKVLLGSLTALYSRKK